jgi:hypothetical protein
VARSARFIAPVTTGGRGLAGSHCSSASGKSPLSLAVDRLEVRNLLVIHDGKRIFQRCAAGIGREHIYELCSVTTAIAALTFAWDRTEGSAQGLCER